MLILSTEPLGAPWSRSQIGSAGRLDKLTVRSELLKDNPLGDPCTRPLWVYVPAVAVTDPRRPLPVIYLIQGFGGQVDMWDHRPAHEPTLVERLNMLFAGGAPPALVVMPDGWTRYGGSQFVNSIGTGRYLDYLCDEIVPFIDAQYSTLPSRGHRGITGKSSGGYAAMAAPMHRPDVFGAFASHAGDALFECCCLPKFPLIARTLRDHFQGSYELFLQRFAEADTIDPALFGAGLEFYAYATCYSPDPGRPGIGLPPFDVGTGRLIEDLWAQWLANDPVRLAQGHGDALASMSLIYLDSGLADEHYLDLGATAFSQELTRLGLEHKIELFPGTHARLEYRYPRAIGALAEALTP